MPNPISFGAKHKVPKGLYQVVFVDKANQPQQVLPTRQDDIFDRLILDVDPSKYHAFADRRIWNRLLPHNLFVMGDSLRKELADKVAEQLKTIRQTAFFKAALAKDAQTEGKNAATRRENDPNQPLLDALSPELGDDLHIVCAEALVVQTHQQTAGLGTLRIRALKNERPYRGRFKVMEIIPPKPPQGTR